MQASSRIVTKFAKNVGAFVHPTRSADEGPPWPRTHFRTVGVVLMPPRADCHTGGSARGGARVIRGPRSRSRLGKFMEHVHASV